MSVVTNDKLIRMLRMRIESGTRPEEVAVVADSSVSSVYRWLEEERPPKNIHVRLALEKWLLKESR